MCILCELRRHIANGDDEAELTAEALVDPNLAAGMALMIGALMNKFGLEEFSLDPLQFDMASTPALAFQRDGPMLTARVVQESEIPAEIKLARGMHTLN